MLESKNDNLQNADGENMLPMTEQLENPETASIETSTDLSSQNVIDAIVNSNAEESEDETLKDRHDIPMVDYESLSMEDLVNELENLVTVEKIMSVKEHIEHIKTAFFNKYNHFIDEKRDEFIAENSENNEEFHFHLPLKFARPTTFIN